MEVVVNDTNILIDLYNADLLKFCGRISLEFHTLPVIIEEMSEPNQRAQVESLISAGILKVNPLTSTQLIKVQQKRKEFSGQNNLSGPDISVMVYAKENNYRLLTGDKKLRKQAEIEGVEVSGVLYLTDRILAEGIVDEFSMADILECLMNSNDSLPKSIIREKIQYLREESRGFHFKR